MQRNAAPGRGVETERTAEVAPAERSSQQTVGNQDEQGLKAAREANELRLEEQVRAREKAEEIAEQRSRESESLNRAFEIASLFAQEQVESDERAALADEFRARIDEVFVERQQSQADAIDQDIQNEEVARLQQQAKEELKIENLGVAEKEDEEKAINLEVNLQQEAERQRLEEPSVYENVADLQEFNPLEESLDELFNAASILDRAANQLDGARAEATRVSRELIGQESLLRGVVESLGGLTAEAEQIAELENVEAGLIQQREQEIDNLANVIEQNRAAQYNSTTSVEAGSLFSFLA